MVTKRKICIVTSSFPCQESERSGKFIDDLLRKLPDEYEVHVIYPSNMERARIETDRFCLHQIPYPFHAYPMSQVKGFDLVNTIRFALSMRNEISAVVQKYNIDLIHAFWAIPSGLIAMLSQSKIPVVVTLPGSDIKIFARRRWFKPFIKYVLKRAPRMIAVSDDLKLEAVKLGSHHSAISVIPAGVDTHIFKPEDKNRLRATLNLPVGFLMIYAGSLLKVKRVDRLIRLCAQLREDIHCNCNLLIVGDGLEKANLMKLTENLNLNNVRFLGEVLHENMPQYMAASDVLLLASESEGMPGCVQEAMACGIPVVTSNVGGLPEIVINGVNGYITATDNEMLEKIRLMISSPQMMVTMGTRARAFAEEHFSLDKIVIQVDEIYNSLLLANDPIGLMS